MLEELFYKALLRKRRRDFDNPDLLLKLKETRLIPILEERLAC